MLNTKIETTVNGYTGCVTFYDNGSPEFLINGERSGINTYDLEYYGRGYQHANRPCYQEKEYCFPPYFQSLLASPTGDLITVVAQAIASNEVQIEIKNEIAARQQAIAPTDTWVPAISIADGWDLKLGYAKHNNNSTWLFDVQECFNGAAEQAIKRLVYIWDLPRVSGTQSGVILVCTKNQLQQLKDAASAAKSAEEKNELKNEILETEAILKSLGDPAKLPSKETALKHQKAYNDLLNEGGDGYLPSFPAIEDHHFYTEKLNQLKDAINAL